jgi:hypothetical protein
LKKENEGDVLHSFHLGKLTSRRSCFSAAAGVDVDSLRHFWNSFWLFSRSGDIFAHFIPLGVVVPLQYVCAILPESRTHTHRQAGRQHTNQPTSNLHNAHVPLHRSLFFARGCRSLARFLSSLLRLVARLLRSDE